MALLKLAGLVFAMAMMSVPAFAADVTITGTVAYRERIALPADAQLRVTLVTLPAAEPVVGASATIPARGQPPIAFTLNVRTTLASDRDYGLLAEISSAGHTLFASTAPVAVDPDAGAPVRINVNFAGLPPAPPPEPPAPAPSALLDTVWTVTSIGGRPVSGIKSLTLSIAADLRTGGHGGCNNYFTEASIEGNKLAFGPTAATRMACAPEILAQEASYFSALAAVAGYETDGRSLRLLDAAGVPLIGLVRKED